MKDKKNLIYKFFVSFFLFFTSYFLFPISSYAFDVKGLQPLSPYGVFSTFSAESLRQNKVGFGFGIEKSVDPDFYRTTSQFAYGLHDRVEFNLTHHYITRWSGTMDGPEDVNFGVKHRIIDETDYTPAIAYLVAASLPSGKDTFSTDGRFGGGLLLTKKIGPFKGHLNLLYYNPQKENLKNEYNLNFGTELAISHNSKILAEIVGKKDFYKNKLTLLEWRLGYRIATTDYIYTTVGAGFDIKNRTPDYRLFFSVSILLPMEKKKIQRIYEE
ncbi:MAG: hypothetical protein C0415_06205 [Thermodesulfovibrio sp.]|nr:hypothetical protein [Thermodesulfovibrio sp.]